MKEEQKAAHPEKDLVGLFEERLDELEKKTDGTQTLVEEMKNQKKYSNLTTRHKSFAGIVNSTQKE